jgi:hypothetical protein
MASQSIKTISFSEIVHGRESDVRVTEDGLLYAVDIVMVISGKNRNDAGQAIRNLDPDVFQSVKFTERQMSTRGGFPTKLLTLQHAIELIMALPGKLASEARVQCANIIRRYMAGDGSLVPEIQANATSNSPLAQMARDSLGGDSTELEYNKKRKRELEDLEICERRLALEKGRAELDLFKVKAPVDFIILCVTTIENMCGGLEDRDKLRYRALLNISVDSQARYLTNSMSAPAGGVEQVEAPKMPMPTSIAAIVSSMKINGLKSSDYQQIGKIAKRMYMASHDGKVPTKHDQEGANGQWFQVNDYFLETDEEMLKDAVNEHMAKRR